MKQWANKTVGIVYCDNCGQEAGLPRYGLGGKDYCAACKPWSMADIKAQAAKVIIRQQPFFGRLDQNQ